VQRANPWIGGSCYQNPTRRGHGRPGASIPLSHVDPTRVVGAFCAAHEADILSQLVSAAKSRADSGAFVWSRLETFDEFQTWFQQVLKSAGFPTLSWSSRSDRGAHLAEASCINSSPKPRLGFEVCGTGQWLGVGADLSGRDGVQQVDRCLSEHQASPGGASTAESPESRQSGAAHRYEEATTSNGRRWLAGRRGAPSLGTLFSYAPEPRLPLRVLAVRKRKVIWS
jgi:hypothetical protein